MRTSTSLWSRVTQQLFGKSAAASKRSSTRNRGTSRQRKFENLESRAVFDVEFGSALSIGSDEVGRHAAWDVATDAAGNSYVTGGFEGLVDFDQGATHPNDIDILASRGSGDAFVAKYAPDNTLIWVTRMGGDYVEPFYSDFGRRISVDAAGTVYVAGKFRGPADFGSTTLESVGAHDGFVAKLSPGGVVQWAKRWGIAEQPDTTIDDAFGLDIDSAGNVYALGTRNSAGFDVRKYNPSGNLIWTKSVETKSIGSDHDLAVSPVGDVYVAGAFRGTVDFDPSSKTKNVASIGYKASFVLKLDTNGKFGWVSPFVGRSVGSTIGLSSIRSVAVDGGGNVIVGGSYKDSVDFDPGRGVTTLPTSNGIYTGFVAKLNQSGSLIWACAFVSSSSSHVEALDVDAAGNIYAAGSFAGSVDLDPGSGSNLRMDTDGRSFVTKLNSAGNFDWGATYGSGNLRGVAVDPSGAIHIAGLFAGTVDFDPNPDSIFNLTTPGTTKGFRLLLRQT